MYSFWGGAYERSRALADRGRPVGVAGCCPSVFRSLFPVERRVAEGVAADAAGIRGPRFLHRIDRGNARGRFAFLPGCAARSHSAESFIAYGRGGFLDVPAVDSVCGLRFGDLA